MVEELPDVELRKLSISRPRNEDSDKLVRPVPLLLECPLDLKTIFKLIIHFNLIQLLLYLCFILLS